MINPDDSNFSLLITETIDLDVLKSYGLPIIIDFGADSCIPCKEMAPVLEELNSNYQGKAIIRFVDVWKYPEIANGFPVNLIPTQVFFSSEGEPYIPSEELGIPMTLYSTKDTNEHIFTTHEGGIGKEELVKILKEMGLTE